MTEHVGFLVTAPWAWKGGLHRRSLDGRHVNEERKEGEVGALQAGSPTQLTSSLKGMKGTVGSSRCMSSLSRARIHSTRLSTSRAMGPATVVTEQKGGRFRSSFLLWGPPLPGLGGWGPGLRSGSKGPGANLGQGLKTGRVGTPAKAALGPDRRISAGAVHQETSRRD